MLFSRVLSNYLLWQLILGLAAEMPEAYQESETQVSQSSSGNYLIKHPVRDACLHMGGILTEGTAVSAGSAVCLPVASLLVNGISSNLAHIFSSPGKIF